jgi:predicted DNA-binding transcriptional regulator YafY
VRLCFLPEAARYGRERVWHPSQQLRERRDGGLELTLRVSDFLEVKRWVLGYGAACEVVKPAELETEMQEVFALDH